VKRGPLVLAVDREGRVDAAERAKLRAAPAAIGGQLFVAEVLRDAGPVAKDEPVLRLDSASFEDELRAAREALEQARARLDDLAAEARTNDAAARTRLERAEKGRAQAENALEVFERFDGPKMLRAAELELKGREDGLENQKEELAQLEKMYQGTRLSSDTKEIVLERTRRAVALAEAWLAIAKSDRIVTTEFHHPRREQQLKDELRFETEELEEARAATTIAAHRKQAEVEQARIATRNAEERLAKLESDRERLTVRAPIDGILAPIELAAGDPVAPRQPLGQVAAARLLVRVQATAEDLRVLAPGTRVALSFPDYGEVSLAGTVTSIGALGTEAKEATHFATLVAIDGSHPLLRVGLRAAVHAERTIADALVVPRRALRASGRKHLCRVLGPSGPEDREVTLGAASGDLVEIESGLRQDDRVILDAAAPEGAPSENMEKGHDAGKAAAPLGRAAPAPPPLSPARSAEEAAAVEAPPPPPEEAYARGLAFLLRTQNPDGSWGSFESARPGEIYLGTIASHAAFLEATTALCALALDGPSRKDATARAALERALAHMLAAPPVGRATGDTFYDVWTHAYLVTALARLSRDERFAASSAAIGRVVRRELATLADLQSADGGFGYYDFGHSRATPSGHESTSFVTAVVLLALREAARAGFPVKEDEVHDALACLERLRLPSGAYIYGTYAEMRPGVLFNRVKGSLGRSQPCNLALRAYGRDVTREELAAGLAAFREFHHFIEIGKDRPYPHEAWYYTAGYYFLFGHYYAALVIGELDPADQAAYRPWLAATLARLQDPDGSWFDFPLYGYHKQYGTAFALLGLEACLGGAGG
jgi:multidrug resistance efflux pump